MGKLDFFVGVGLTRAYGQDLKVVAYHRFLARPVGCFGTPLKSS